VNWRWSALATVSGAAVRAHEIQQPQRIVTKQVIEVVNQPDVRPMIIDADQLDPIAAIGGGRRPQRDLSSVTVSSVVSGRSASNIAGGKPVDSVGALFQARSAR
jgi:hypothetical protein